MNLRRGDDWDTMCKTTPATIYGQHFDQPTTCIDEVGLAARQLIVQF